MGGGTYLGSVINGLGPVIDVGSMIGSKRDGHKTIIRNHPFELQDVLNGHVGIGRCPVLRAERLAITTHETPGFIDRPHSFEAAAHTVGPGSNDLPDYGLEVTALHPSHRHGPGCEGKVEAGLVSLPKRQMVVQNFCLKPLDQRFFDGPADFA